MASEELVHKTVTSKLAMLWCAHPDRTVMVFRDVTTDHRTTLTNTDVRDLSMRCAAYMASHGVKKGDVVCNMLGASLEREIVNFGVLLAGGVVMHGGDAAIEDTTNGGGTTAATGFWQPISQAKVKFMVVCPEAGDVGWEMVREDVGLSDADVEVMTRTPDAPSVKKVFKFNLAHKINNCGTEKCVCNFDRNEPRSAFDIFRAFQGHYIPPEEGIHPNDPCSILVAKQEADQESYLLVERDHLSVIKLGHRLQGMLGYTSSDVVYDDQRLQPGPLYPYITVCCPCVMSSLMELPESRQAALDTWRLMEEEQVTMAGLSFPVVKMLSSLCEDLREEEEPRRHMLRLVSLDGHKDSARRQSIVDAVGVVTRSVAMCYSRIETGLVSRLIVDEGNKRSYFAGLVGDVVDPNQSKAYHDVMASRSKASGILNTIWNVSTHLSPMGEIILSGGLVAKEYLNDPVNTKAAFSKEGVFSTGDIGLYNERGQLVVLGRRCDALIIDNKPIFPRDIEEQLQKCPGLRKVIIVPFTDETRAVKMCACVIPRSADVDTIEAVKEYIFYQFGITLPRKSERKTSWTSTLSNDYDPHMPSYIIFLESYPMTASGQVNRNLLAYMVSQIM